MRPKSTQLGDQAAPTPSTPPHPLNEKSSRFCGLIRLESKNRKAGFEQSRNRFSVLQKLGRNPVFG